MQDSKKTGETVKMDWMEKSMCRVINPSPPCHHVCALLQKERRRYITFLMGDDCLSTISCFRKLGVLIVVSDDEIMYTVRAGDGLEEPVDILDTGNSGTTTRLIMGLLAGRPFHSILIGDESIARRP